MSAQRIVPYLTVEGGLEAIRYYEEAFDAVTVTVMMAEDGKRVMHAELEVLDCPLMLADSFAEMGGSTSAPGTAGGTSVTIHFDFKKPKQVDRAVEQAVKAGASIVMPVQDMFWGARYGRIRDPFGHVWSFNAPLKKKNMEKHGDGDNHRA